MQTVAEVDYLSKKRYALQLLMTFSIVVTLESTEL